MVVCWRAEVDGVAVVRERTGTVEIFLAGRTRLLGRPCDVEAIPKGLVVLGVIVADERVVCRLLRSKARRWRLTEGVVDVLQAFVAAGEMEVEEAAGRRRTPKNDL